VVKVPDIKPLLPHRCEFESLQGIRIFSCEEAIQLAYETTVFLLRYPFTPEGHLRSSSTSEAGK
jgi:hypothetical protein